MGHNQPQATLECLVCGSHVFTIRERESSCAKCGASIKQAAFTRTTKPKVKKQEAGNDRH